MGKKAIVGIILAVVMLTTGGIYLAVNAIKQNSELVSGTKEQKMKFFACELKLCNELDMTILASKDIISTYKIGWYGIYHGDVDRMISRISDLMEPEYSKLDSCLSSIAYWSTLINDHPANFSQLHDKTMELYNKVVKYASYAYLTDENYFDYMVETENLLAEISERKGEIGVLITQ